ncbi:MAG: 50S ribosomal protein L18Ae [Acidilobaceae archaeon]
MNEVKVYLVEGYMLVAHDKNPEWRKFRKYVRALKPEHALELVYSELGSKHKLKRSHINIERVVEIPITEVEDKNIIKLPLLDRIVV